MPPAQRPPPTHADAKADFGDCYTAPDPRPYFRTLVPLEYQIPQQAQPVLEDVIAAASGPGPDVTVLDVCCSYGLNAALLRCAVDLRELGRRYTDPELVALSTDELREADRGFYGERRRHRERQVFGLDVSAPAVDYAVGVGMMDGGWVEDLEAHDPSPALAAALRHVDVVTCTGGIGYIGEATFGRLLAAMARPAKASVVMFVLRMLAVDDVARTLARFGLVTERVPGWTVRQRRFADADEQRSAVRRLRRRGLDPAGLESDGWYYADCFVARPRDDAARTPITDVVRGREGFAVDGDIAATGPR